MRRFKMHYLSMPFCFSAEVEDNVILHSKVTESLPLFNLKQRRNNSATALKGICSWPVIWNLLFSEIGNESREGALPSERSVKEQ